MRANGLARQPKLREHRGLGLEEGSRQISRRREPERSAVSSPRQSPRQCVAWKPLPSNRRAFRRDIRARWRRDVRAGAVRGLTTVALPLPPFHGWTLTPLNDL